MTTTDYNNDSQSWLRTQSLGPLMFVFASLPQLADFVVTIS